MKKQISTKEFEVWINQKIAAVTKHLLIDFAKGHLKFLYDSNGKRNVNVNIIEDRVFSIRYTRRYRHFHLTSYPVAYEMWKDKKYNDLIHILIHELSHIHVIPLADVAESRYIQRTQLVELAEELTEIIAEYLRRYIKKVDASIYH